MVAVRGRLLAEALASMGVVLVYLATAFGVPAAIAAARATPAAFRWWRRRRARIDSAERVTRRLAVKDEIQRHLPARTEYRRRRRRRLNENLALMRARRCVAWR
jgi:hypothetical protein